MPSNRHSYAVLTIVCVCVFGVCAFLFWQNRQKKNELARQFAELSMPPHAQGGTPAQQKALLEILSGKQNAGSSENLLSFRGIPYIMFTCSFPRCPKSYYTPEAFCLFPDGRALVIYNHEYEHSLSVGRDEQGRVEYGFYHHHLFRQGTWSREGMEGRQLVIREEEEEKFRGSIYANTDGVLTLEEYVPAVLPENGDEPEPARRVHQYRAQNIPPETEKLCRLAAPLLEVPETTLPLEYVERAIRALAKKLHVKEELLSPCLISSHDHPPALYLLKKDKKGHLYKLTSQKTKTQVEELSPSREPVAEPFLLNIDFSGLDDAIRKTQQTIHDLPAPDRENTQNISIRFLDENTVEIEAIDDLRAWKGTITTYTFKLRDGRWKLTAKGGFDP